MVRDLEPPFEKTENVIRDAILVSYNCQYFARVKITFALYVKYKI